MRAVIGDRFGGIECLRLDETPSPALAAGTVRIAVRAAGVSFANLLFIAGKHQNRPDLPFIPGTEIAGIVTEIAPDVRNDLRIGDSTSPAAVAPTSCSIRSAATCLISRCAASHRWRGC